MHVVIQIGNNKRHGGKLRKIAGKVGEDIVGDGWELIRWNRCGFGLPVRPRVMSPPVSYIRRGGGARGPISVPTRAQSFAVDAETEAGGEQLRPKVRSRERITHHESVAGDSL